MDVQSRNRRTSLGLTIQDLLDEVVDDEAIVSGEARDETVQVVAALHRQGCQLKRGDPSLRAFLQRIDLADVEVQAGRPVQVGRGLVARESKVGGSYLDELTLSP